MKLNVGDRITLLGVLPQEGNFITLKIIRDLQGKLSFQEAELKKYEIKQEQDGDKVRTTWNEKGITEENEIEIGEKATDIIVKALKKIDELEKLTPPQMSVYEKFIKP